jgi:hypothetical protein
MHRRANHRRAPKSRLRAPNNGNLLAYFLQGRDNPGRGGLDEVPIPETLSMSYKKIRRTLIPSHKSFAENLNRQENDKITRYPSMAKADSTEK